MVDPVLWLQLPNKPSKEFHCCHLVYSTMVVSYITSALTSLCWFSIQPVTVSTQQHTLKSVSGANWSLWNSFSSKLAARVCQVKLDKHKLHSKPHKTHLMSKVVFILWSSSKALVSRGNQNVQLPFRLPRLSLPLEPWVISITYSGDILLNTPSHLRLDFQILIIESKKISGFFFFRKQFHGSTYEKKAILSLVLSLQKQYWLSLVKNVIYCTLIFTKSSNWIHLIIIFS